MKQYILLFTVLSLVFASCSKSDLQEELNESIQNKVPIINVPEGAVKGQLLVKFKSNISTTIQETSLKSGNSKVISSGVKNVDQVLEGIGIKQLERVFPVDQRNEIRTQEAGLNRWYVINFDETADLTDVAQQLAQMGEVEKIQYSHPVRPVYEVSQRATAMPSVTQAALKARSLKSESSSVFNDPALPAQWGYINNGRLLADGTTNQMGDEIVQAIQGVDVGCKEAWELCTGDPSVIVAVLDEGVMFNHPDLKANMWVNEGEILGSDMDIDGNGYAGDKYGFNFVQDQGLITYSGTGDSGHGTHVAGTIAAVNNNGTGVCGVAGGNGTENSGVKIMSCQVFDNGSGVSMYQEAKAIKYAADNGAVILQCSWGYNSGLANALEYTPGFITDEGWVDGAPLEKEALDYFIHNAGSPNGVIDGGVVVFAGGNESSAMAGYPGAYPDYIAVSAVCADGTPSCFTNYGQGIRIAAPGGDSDYHRCDEGKVYSTIPPFDGDYYGYMEGTSMACPHVSGVVALGLSYAVKLQRHFTASEFRELVLQSVSDASLESYFTDTKVYYENYAVYGFTSAMQMSPGEYNGHMGSGLINAYKLLKNIEGGGVEMKVPNVFVAVDGETTINFARYFSNGSQLTYSCSIENSSIVQGLSNDQVTYTFTGIAVGSTKAVVKASDGTEQIFYLTVRKENSWL